MKHIHIVTGTVQAQHIAAALEEFKVADAEVLTITDDYSYGPLRQPDVPFSLLRNQFWNGLKNDLNNSYELRDLEQVLELLNRSKEAEGAIAVHFWMSDKTAELLTYYFLLHYLKPLAGQLHIININGLPFLNDDLQLFYPRSFTEINARGIIKALKLSRPVTLSEIEADGDEWKFFQQHPGTVRILSGGKQVAVYEAHYYDEKILDAVALHPQKKWARIWPQVKPQATEFDLLVLNDRLQQLIQASKLKVDGGNLVINQPVVE